jgi:hypothetical protein
MKTQASGNPPLIKSRFLATLIAILWAVTFGPVAHAALTTNTWSNAASGTWNWVNASNWLLGLAPNINQSAILITNQAGFMAGAHNLTVTIDSTTVAQPVTMTVSNVFISAPGTGAKAAHNTLFLNNAGLVTPLKITGSLSIANNGTVIITNSLLVVGFPQAFNGNGVFIDGALQLQSGSLIATSVVSFIVGESGAGQMTVLDGIWQTATVVIGDLSGSQGMLTLAGGTSVLSYLVISLVPGGDGSVLMTGGSLTTAEADIGYIGTGQMTISGGTWLAGNVNVGAWSDDIYGSGQGTLTVAGGTTVIDGTGLLLNDFNIAYENGTTGFVWMTGGQLITTNTSTYVGHSFEGFGQMVVSNGAWQARDVTVGTGGGALGTFRLVGGTTTISSNLVLGDCTDGSVGEVYLAGGILYVTNATHTAVVDIENGALTINGGGTLVVDVFVMTNPCANFVRAGGILIYRTAILDPDGDADQDGLPNWWEQAHGLDPLDPADNNGPFGDPDGDGYSNWEEYLAGSDPRNPLSTPLQITPPPFQITSMVRSGNNIVLTWMTPAGTTNQLEVTSGGSGGAFSTNGFTNLGAQMLIGGSGAITTNFTDVGGATNKPARYYRVRLVP